MIKARIKKYKYHLLAVAFMVLVLTFLSTNIFVPCPAPREPSDKFLRENTENIKKNHPGIDFWISSDRNRYSMGDEIRITLHFRNKAKGSFCIDTSTYDRSGRFEENKFVVDGPEGGWADPLEKWMYFAMGGGLGRGSSESLSEAIREYPLNDYIRFDKPGTYYVYCKSSLVAKFLKEKGDPCELTSLPIKIMISEPRYLCTFRKSHTYAIMTFLQNEKLRKYALRKLRYLANHEAADIFVDHFDTDQFEAAFGIFSLRDMAYLKDAMVAGLKNPRIEINESYLYDLSALSVSEDTYSAIKLILNTKERYLEADWTIDKFTKEREGYEAKYLDALYANIGARSGKSLANICYLLLKGKQDYGYHVNYNEKDAHSYLPSKFAEKPELRKIMASVFALLDPREMSNLLEYSWKNISCKEFEAVLKDVIQDCEDKLAHDTESFRRDDMQKLIDYAQIRLLQLQGKENELRKTILDDMKKPRPVFNREILLSLKDETLPELDDILLQNLKNNPGDKVSMLIRRYATSKILPEVIELLEEKSNSRNNLPLDEGQIFAYMMKYQKEDTVRYLKESLAAGNKYSLRALYRLYPDETEEIYLDVIGKLDDKAAGRILLDMAREGTGTKIDGMLTEFEILTMKPAEGFNESGEYKDCYMRSHVLLLLLQNKKMKFTQAQKDRLFSILRAEEKKIFEEQQQSVSK